MDADAGEEERKERSWDLGGNQFILDKPPDDYAAFVKKLVNIKKTHSFFVSIIIANQEPPTTHGHMTSY